MIGRRSFVTALLGALALRRWPKPKFTWDSRQTPQLARRGTRHTVIDLTVAHSAAGLFCTAFENDDRLTVDMGRGRVYHHARVRSYSVTPHGVVVSLHV